MMMRLTVFDKGGDAMRKKKPCLEWVSTVNAAAGSRAGEGSHRPVAQNGANAVIFMVADQDATFIVGAYFCWSPEPGSERLVAFNVGTRISDWSTSSECADTAVVVDDPQAVFKVP